MTICQGTIEDFIDFTRFENNKGLPVNKESVNITTFFYDIQNIFSFQAEEKGIEFGIEISKHITILTIINMYGNSTFI